MVAAALVAIAPAVRSATVRVPQDRRTIRAALEAAAPADTILIDCGTYQENGLQVTRDVVIRSTGGTPDCVTLDGGALAGIFECTGDGFLDLAGFTVVRSVGSAINVSSHQNVRLADCIFRDNIAARGAALRIRPELDSIVVDIRRCTFVRNQATDSGGALFCPFNGGTTILESTFTGNLARGAGAIRLGGPATIIDCAFRQNVAGSAGAVYADEGVELRSCTFEDNRATAWGGGALAYIGNGYGYAQSFDCTLRGNTAVVGGAILLARAGAVRLEGFVVEDNSAESGGAAYIDRTVGRFVGCRFQNNVAGSGGAIAIEGGTMQSQDSIFFANLASAQGGVVHLDTRSSAGFTGSTLCGNGAATGGGIYWSGGPSSALSLDGCILAFSASGGSLFRNTVGPSATVRCTDVFGNVGGDWIGPLRAHEGAAGNFSTDPLFLDHAGGALALSPDSPCTPGNSPAGCGLVGALPAAAEPVHVRPATWGRLKAGFR